MQTDLSMEKAGLGRSETHDMIAASKVEGTYVYNLQGEHLGHIYDTMIEKRSGQIAYAVMSFGGFLGIGEQYHPLPWSMLEYDPAMGGYRVDLDRDVLEGAPSYARGAEPDWADPAYGRSVDDYYRRKPAIY